jgi:hypothetical protein
MVLLPGCVCCGPVCSVSDGKPRSDPANEGNWAPSGTWKTSVTWTFTENPGDDSGENWYFYGSSGTSGAGSGGLEVSEWGNICNWWSSRNVSPSESIFTASSFVKRATRLPPASAVVHIYTNVNTSSVGPQTVKNLYVWNGIIKGGSEITATGTAHDASGGAVFNGSGSPQVIENGATINGGAQLNGPSGYMFTRGTINGGAVFYGFSFLGLSGTVNGGATFNDDSAISENAATVNGGAVFNDRSFSNGLLITVNGGAVFNNQGQNGVTVYGGAVFNDNSGNYGEVYGGAVFNDSSINYSGTVYGGATFNDAACSTRFVGSRTPAPCTKKFVAHPTDLPTCSGTALTGCDAANVNCGCG